MQNEHTDFLYDDNAIKKEVVLSAAKMKAIKDIHIKLNNII